jgi:hypothetical protein
MVVALPAPEPPPAIVYFAPSARAFSRFEGFTNIPCFFP